MLVGSLDCIYVKLHALFFISHTKTREILDVKTVSKIKV